MVTVSFFCISYVFVKLQAYNTFNFKVNNPNHILRAGIRTTGGFSIFESIILAIQFSPGEN